MEGLGKAITQNRRVGGGKKKNPKLKNKNMWACVCTCVRPCVWACLSRCVHRCSRSKASNRRRSMASGGGGGPVLKQPLGLFVFSPLPTRVSSPSCRFSARWHKWWECAPVLWTRPYPISMGWPPGGYMILLRGGVAKFRCCCVLAHVSHQPPPQRCSQAYRKCGAGQAALGALSSCLKAANVQRDFHAAM